MPFPEVLRAFEKQIAATGAGVARLLAPGLCEQHIRDALAPLGMEPPQELVDWFGWHDGLTTAHPSSWGDGLLVRWYPFSLREALHEWSQYDKSLEPWHWHPTWLPIGSHGNATRLAVDCTPPQSGLARLHAAAPVSGFFNFEAEPVVSGFAQVVRWWMQAVEHGWVDYDSDSDTWDTTRWSEAPREWRLTGLI